MTERRAPAAGTRTLIVLTRYPEPGRVKTRLQPALGPEGAASIHRRLAGRTVLTARVACRDVGARLRVVHDGGTTRQLRRWLGEGIEFAPQAPGDLGLRMAGALEGGLQGGGGPVVLVGSDCPGLDVGTLARAFLALSDRDLVLGPATDGGYYLIGMRRLDPALFTGVPWSTTEVFARTIEAARKAGLSVAILDPLGDVDRPEDLPLLDASSGSPSGRRDAPWLSVIVPARNEATRVAEVVDRARRPGAEVIVVDGESSDGTPWIASDRGARVIASRPGRALQQNVGALAAEGRALLFLHADTLLPEGWDAVIRSMLEDSKVAAGAFRLSIGGRGASLRVIEASANWRSTWLGAPYGDQGIFLRRERFEELGGFSDLPLLEDMDLVRRLRRTGRVVTADSAATTSDRRWRRFGPWRTTIINRLVLLGYRLGVPAGELAALYGSRDDDAPLEGTRVPDPGGPGATGGGAAGAGGGQP